MKRGLIICTFALFAGMGCASDDPSAPQETPEPTQFLTNTSVEDGQGGPTGWRSGFGWSGAFGRGNDYVVEWTDREAASGHKSLKFELITVADENHFAYWNQTLDSNIPYDKRLELAVAIKTALVGDGVAITVRGDAGAFPVMGATTQSAVEITGTMDWTIFELDVGLVTAQVDKLHVFLVILPGTTGSVYFDDITLSVVEE